VLVSPAIRQTAGPHAKKRSPADHAGAPKVSLKAIHNELPAAAHVKVVMPIARVRHL
jgi:hypothetical protein